MIVERSRSIIERIRVELQLMGHEFTEEIDMESALVLKRQFDRDTMPEHIREAPNGSIIITVNGTSHTFMPTHTERNNLLVDKENIEWIMTLVGGIMHNLLFMTFPKDYADSVVKAQTFALKYFDSIPYLNPDNDQPMPFFRPKVAYRVIGGRASGCLQEVGALADYTAVVAEKLGLPNRNIGIWIRDIENNQASIQQIWQNRGGKGKSPLLRRLDTKHELYDDDAMIITDEIYHHWLKKYEGKRIYEHRYEDEGVELLFTEYIDAGSAEFSCLDENAIGTRWVVVIDYCT